MSPIEKQRLRRSLATLTPVIVAILVLLCCTGLALGWTRIRAEGAIPWDAELIGATGTWIVGLLVPAVGGLIAWKTLAANETQRRHAAWMKALQIAVRTPEPDNYARIESHKTFRVTVSPMEGEYITNLQIGIVHRSDAGQPQTNYENDFDNFLDEYTDDTPCKEETNKSREYSFSALQLGGRTYVHLHKFPEGIDKKLEPDIKERYKRAITALGPDVVVNFTLNGYIFTRQQGLLFFIDEAPYEQYRRARTLERLALPEALNGVAR